LSRDPDADGQAPFERPTLILTGRQDDAVGYLDQWRLLPHYPRATFAVLDVAGHNLQIEQPELFTALMLEWLDRVGADGRMAPG
jgi:pimeloyl-ACP methyl ester carboxylesterase